MIYTLNVTLSKEGEAIEKEYNDIFVNESFELAEYITPIYKRLHSNKLFNSVLSVSTRGTNAEGFKEFKKFCNDMSDLVEIGYDIQNITIKDTNNEKYYDIDNAYIVDFDYESRLNQRDSEYFLDFILLFYLIKED